jgi:hypothetical protein
VLASQQMAGDRGNPRWPVSYTATILAPAVEPVYLDGELFLRQEIARLMLLDADGSTIDARSRGRGGDRRSLHRVPGSPREDSAAEDPRRASARRRSLAEPHRGRGKAV